MTWKMATIALALGWALEWSGGWPGPAAAQKLPTGQMLTPLAAPGATVTTLDPQLAGYPGYRAGQAAATALSPDGKILLVLTSGYNRLFDAAGTIDPAASMEHVFVYDVTGPHARRPAVIQVIAMPNSFDGLAWAPDGHSFYVAGGSDDVIGAFQRAPAGFVAAKTYPLGHAGHAHGLRQKPLVADLAVTPDGLRVVAADPFNDSLSLLTLATGAVEELDLRPSDGSAGGETPLAVAIGADGRAYVGSVRDREVVIVALTGPARVVGRVALPGTPTALLLSHDGRTLYVAQDNSDQIGVIDTASLVARGAIAAAAPAGLASGRRLTGVGLNALALSADGRTLYASQGGANAVAVIALGPDGLGTVTGLIPTGWFPDALSLAANGRELYVANGRGLSGPNPLHPYGDSDRLAGRKAADAAAGRAANQYILQIEPASLLSLPLPNARALAKLSRQVAVNDLYQRHAPTPSTLMATLHRRIHHVIYVIKENRTYDQVLGDLPNRSNGDPSLAMFGAKLTPNQHRLALDFVTLDNFYDSGEVSGNGWQWSTAARETDWNARIVPLQYGRRGTPYEAEGENRNVNIAILTLAGRRAANPATPDDAKLLPGGNDDDAPDGPDGARQQGYLWSAALRAKLSVRNYGCYVDLTRYGLAGAAGIAEDVLPAADHLQVAYATNAELAPLTDLYFRGFDGAFPDVFREAEWAREFDLFVQAGTLPALSLVRLGHDHTGDFARAIAGVNTPETQIADNDLALGRLVERVAHSRYATDTLIFVLEDDAQDGPDHVDAHRSIGFVVGPYVRQHAVVSTHYTTVNMVRTIEDVLGIGPNNLNDADQSAMAAVFDLAQRRWTFDAVASDALRGTMLAGLRFADASAYKQRHPAGWWAARTAGYDFSQEDRVPAAAFNRLTWLGVIGTLNYPSRRDGKDMRQARAGVKAADAAGESQ